MICRECHLWRKFFAVVALALLFLIVANEIEFHKIRRDNRARERTALKR